jgi:hypothetical protein
MSGAEIEEIIRLAQNIGRCGYHVFPVGDDKRPTIKGWPERASTDPEAIWRLWHDRFGPLIGILTGVKSDLDVLDIDVKHASATAWWRANFSRLLPCRTYRTRSGGLHLYFRHRPGIGNTQGRLALGVDTRGEGGYVVYWFACGLSCLDHSPPAIFPDWLAKALEPPPAPPRPEWVDRERNPEKAIAGLLDWLRSQPDGTRNAAIFWVACRLADRGMRHAQVEALILPVAADMGLVKAADVREVRATIASAIRHGGQAA